MANNEIKVQGKYAEQRREVLENHAPDIYKTMLEQGILEEHLENVQKSAEQYVENYIARYTNSEEYLKAEKKDPAHPFSTGKPLNPWSATGFFAPKINKMEVIFQ